MSTEYTRYSREGIEDLLRNCARARLIVDGMYVGKIGEQELRWLEDGGAEVLTHHIPGELRHVSAQPPRRKQR